MTRINQTFFRSLRFSISKSRLDSAKVFAMLSVKGGRQLVAHLLRCVPLVGGHVSPNWARICYLYLSELNRLSRKSGKPFVIKYLKVCSVITQQVACGYYVPDLTSIGPKVSRAKSGLPRIIPAYQRKLIMSGDKKVLRFWLTAFSMYRDISMLGTLKLSTITSPSTATSRSSLVSRHVNAFSNLFVKTNDKEFLMNEGLIQMLSSGPQASRAEKEYNSAPVVVLRSLINFYRPQHASLLSALKTLMVETNNSVLLSLFTDLSKSVRRNSHITLRSPYLGRLSVKEEAAGKVRLFAMVDPWTQWVLYPIHKKIFNVLKRIPMDSTFDQHRSLKRVPFGKVPIFSFDLSSATDRLPISLQVDILRPIFGNKVATSWATLLVDRDFKVPGPMPGSDFLYKGTIPSSVRYATGQPMGALSSWGMLALTHHYIVHHCAWIAGVVPVGTIFTEYSVLGDDIFIWNKAVASKYLRVLKTLGVEVGLAKSIISNSGKGFEFAKKTFIDGVDVSPIPFKEQSAAHRSFANLRTFAEKYKLSALQVLRFLGYGYKVDPTKNSRTVKALDIAFSIPRTYLELIKLFSFHRQYFDSKALSYPLCDVKKQLVTMIYTQLQQKLKLAKSMHDELVYRFCSVQVDSIGPWQTDTAKIQRAIYEKYAPKYLSDLSYIIQKLKVSIKDITDIYEFYQSFMYDHPYTARQQLSPIPADFLSSISNVFEALDTLDAIQLDLLVSPKPSYSRSPSFLEEQRTLRL